MDQVSRRIEEIAEWGKRGEYKFALILCDDLLMEHPESCEALRERAYLRSRTGNNDGAIDDLTQIISRKPEEPCYFTERADRLIDAGRYQEAVDDLTEALRLCDVWRSDYYRSTAHFVRAYAQLQLRRPVETLDDCSRVENGFRWWIEHGLRTKEMLIADAKALREKDDSSGQTPSGQGDTSVNGAAGQD